MMLPGQEIQNQVEAGTISITPFDAVLFNPNSVTAGLGDVGFSGCRTLEIQCVQPVKIHPMVEICQIYYHRIEGEYTPYAGGKYQNSTGIRPSMIYRDFEKKK